MMNTRFDIVTVEILTLYSKHFHRRRKHNIKFRQIDHTTSQYGQSFFPKTISAWNGLAFAEAPSLYLDKIFFKISGHPFRIIPCCCSPSETYGKEMG